MRRRRFSGGHLVWEEEIILNSLTLVHAPPLSSRCTRQFPPAPFKILLKSFFSGSGPGKLPVLRSRSIKIKKSL